MHVPPWQCALEQFSTFLARHRVQVLAGIPGLSLILPPLEGRKPQEGRGWPPFAKFNLSPFQATVIFAQSRSRYDLKAVTAPNH
jgi:hypothetical protein